MPTIEVYEANLFYKESGSGPETIVFSHGLLMDHTMFEPQRTAFESRYRIIAYDHRAQGQSQDPGYVYRGGHGGSRSYSYSMETLALDAAALITKLNAAPCHFVGLSMGGFVGMRLAAHHPALIRTLTLMNTTADKERLSNRIKYGVLATLVKLLSPAPFTAIAVKELFGQTTRTSPSRRPMLEEWTSKLKSRPRNIARSLSAVMNRKEFTAQELAKIQCPTLIIAGEDDTAQPPRNSQSLVEGIRSARFVRVPGAGHSSSLEEPEAVIAAMRELFQAARKGNASSPSL
jgi:3-oxoadipate enol-lactonase